jgi:hypothetical protein
VFNVLARTKKISHMAKAVHKRHIDEPMAKRYRLVRPKGDAIQAHDTSPTDPTVSRIVNVKVTDIVSKVLLAREVPLPIRSVASWQGKKNIGAGCTSSLDEPPP